MIACVDVHYRAGEAVAAAVAVAKWTDAVASCERTAVLGGVAPYVPGSFYLRELPPLLAVIARLPSAPAIVVIDGYVTLGPKRPGLGEHLRRALPDIAVVGVAKTPFAGATHAVSLLRGTSKKPLFITAAGMTVQDATKAVASMHGPHRIPTILRRVDALTRG